MKKERSLISKQEREREKERDAYSSYHESCIYAMSHFTIKWKAKERGNYECENALDMLSNQAKKKKGEVEKEVELATNGNTLYSFCSRSFTACESFLSNHILIEK